MHSFERISTLANSASPVSATSGNSGCSSTNSFTSLMTCFILICSSCLNGSKISADTSVPIASTMCPRTGRSDISSRSITMSMGVCWNRWYLMNTSRATQTMRLSSFTRSADTPRLVSLTSSPISSRQSDDSTISRSGCGLTPPRYVPMNCGCRVGNTPRPRNDEVTGICSRSASSSTFGIR